MTTKEPINELRPFEWLTSAASLIPLIRPLLALDSNVAARILHVGCGSSVLGEELLLNAPDILQVVNVDNDAEILQRMELRWKNKLMRQRNEERTIIAAKMKFVRADFTNSTALALQVDNSFDMAVSATAPR